MVRVLRISPFFRYGRTLTLFGRGGFPTGRRRCARCYILTRGCRQSNGKYGVGWDGFISRILSYCLVPLIFGRQFASSSDGLARLLGPQKKQSREAAPLNF